MAKKKFTWESNIDKVVARIQETPEKVLNIIGSTLTKEIRGTIDKKRTGRLKMSLGYWARKKEKDLQIGFKIFYAPFVYGNEPDPIKPIVVKNKDLIVDSIAQAIDQINKE